MTLPDGRPVALDGHARALPPGAWLHVRSERSGYIVLPLPRSSAATVRLVHPRPQSSAPRPGPTLAVGLAPTSRFHRLALGVRLATVPADASPAALVMTLERNQ